MAHARSACAISHIQLFARPCRASTRRERAKALRIRHAPGEREFSLLGAFHNVVYQGHKHGKIWYRRDFDGGPVQPLAILVDSQRPLIDLNVFDLVPEDDLLAVAYSVYSYTKLAKGDGLPGIIGIDCLWQQ